MTLQLFAVAASAEAGELIEAIDAETPAAVEASEILPPAATFTIAVALTSPGAHGSEVDGRLFFPILGKK